MQPIPEAVLVRVFLDRGRGLLISILVEILQEGDASRIGPVEVVAVRHDKVHANPSSEILVARGEQTRRIRSSKERAFVDLQV